MTDKIWEGRGASRSAPARLGLGGLTLIVGAMLSGAAAQAEPLLGQPTPGASINFQPAGDAIKRSVIFFHNDILLPIITLITLFVLGLLIYVCWKFRKEANPVPSRFTHNTSVEIAWTVAPVLILMFIAIFSFRLLYAYHDMPNPDLTVKATGNQWYWNYTYPDNGAFTYDSLILPEQKAIAANKPYKLAVDNPLVVPEGAVVRVLVTGADVIHDFALPAFGLKMDAVPGRVNQTWFKAEKTGIYYGECSELCGVDHAFMPIEIDVVPKDKFDAWVLGHSGGKVNAKVLGAGVNTPAAAPVSTTMPAGATVGPSTGAAALQGVTPKRDDLAPVAPPAAQTTRPTPKTPEAGGA